MKKVLSVLLALAMVFCLAACGNEETVDENLPAYSKNLNNGGRFNIKASDYVTLPEYKGVDFGDEFWTVSDEDVQAQIDSLQSSYSTTEQVTNRAIEFGDSVNIDYAGTIDGVAFDGGTATGQTVTAGGTNFIDDFLTQIIGHFPGDEFDIEVTFPDDYDNDGTLSGKDAVFAIKINYIAETVLPEINDEFVKTNFSESYGLNTLEELKAYIYDSLLVQTQQSLIDNYLVENSVVSEVPDVVYENQEAAIRQNYEDTAASYGIDVDTLIAYYGAESLDQVIEESESQIVSMATDIMIYQAIAEAEGIEVKNVDVADYFEEANGSRDYSSIQSAYGLPYLKMVVTVDKVIDLIRDSAVK